MNTELGFGLSDRKNIEMEVASIIAYSFIKETGKSMAPSKPHQTVVPALGLETLVETGLRGEEEGETVVSVLPMFSLWLPKSGWAVRLGMEVPVTRTKAEDFIVHFQFGNHFDWKRLFGRKPKNAKVD